MADQKFLDIATEAVTKYRAAQRSDELADYLEWLSQQDVWSILEVGVERGGLMWAHSRVLPATSLAGLDIRIRQEAKDVAASIRWPKAAEKCRCWLIEGDSRAAFIEREIEDCWVDNFDLVFIDGSHDFYPVVNDFIRYGMKARKWVVFHDIVTTRWNAKVYTFWNDVLPHFEEFGEKHCQWVGKASSYGIGVWKVKER